MVDNDIELWESVIKVNSEMIAWFSRDIGYNLKLRDRTEDLKLRFEINALVNKEQVQIDAIYQRIKRYQGLINERRSNKQLSTQS